MKPYDIYIMIPITGKAPADTAAEISDDIRLFLTELEQTAQYECDSRIADTLRRFSLGSYKIAYMDDTYQNILDWLDCELALTHQNNTGLGILWLILRQCDVNPTQIGDIVSSGQIHIKADDKKIPLDVFLNERYRWKNCGQARVIYCMDAASNFQQRLQYLLAGETDSSAKTDSRIHENALSDICSNDLSFYDFYKLYASERSVIYILNEMSDTFKENFPQEALLLYICEIAVLQNAAIYRINWMIADELTTNSNISSKTTLAMQVEFGKTILLWDNMIYSYLASQQVSSRIIDAFGTRHLFDEYQKNCAHLEQIASLKGNISSEREGKILNALAFILSINELIQIVRNIALHAQGLPLQLGAMGGSFTVLVILWILIRRNKRSQAQ